MEPTAPGCGETRARRLRKLQADCVLSAGREPLSLPGSLPRPRQLQERGLLCTQPAHGPEVLQSKVALKNPSTQPPRASDQPVPSVPPLPAQVGLGLGLQKVDLFKGSPRPRPLWSQLETGLGWKLGPKMLGLCRARGCNSSPPGRGVSDRARLSSDACKRCVYLSFSMSRFLPPSRRLSENSLGSAVEGKPPDRLRGPQLRLRRLPGGSGPAAEEGSPGLGQGARRHGPRRPGGPTL